MEKHLRSGMKPLILLLVLFFISAPSCSVSRSKVEDQRRGLMIQDKSQYDRNKKKFKKSKAYKKQKARHRYYKRR